MARVSLARARGALVGVAVGDALGAPFEGREVVSDDAFERVAVGSSALAFTDDTHMTLVFAECLVEAGGAVDGGRLASRFADAYEAEPWRGYGAGPPAVFARLRAGATWDEPAAELFDGAGSFGNGGAMRAAPAGVVAAPDHGRAAELARAGARITHSHPLGLDGAAVVAVAVSLALAAVESPLDGSQLLDEVAEAARPGDAMRGRLSEVGRLLDTGAAPGEAASVLGTGVTAAESVPAALFAALSASSFEVAVRTAVLMGGDTDTVAAMAGAVAGAAHGEEAIPEPWRARVEGVERLRELADALVAVDARP